MAGIDLVSMVTGLSIGKPDDASSTADSAIATSIAEVSQYSEVRDILQWRRKMIKDGGALDIVAACEKNWTTPTFH